MPVDLTAASDDVLERFNARDYNGLIAVMHRDIVLKKVLHPGSVVGIVDARDYLFKHMLPREPSFEDLAEVAYYPKDKAIQKSAKNANVGGIGIYYDDNRKTRTRVHFTWIFTRTDNTKEWSLINAFGAPES